MTVNLNQQHADKQLSHPKYRPDIDGLRAIAVLSVVIFHAFPTWVKGGFVGVDIFFVISGFLISTIIFENLSKDSFSFFEFYSRRVKRIYPVLLVVLSVCFLFGWFALLADEFKILGKHLAAGAGFVSNLVLWSESGYFDNAADTKPLLHLWSLGVEEQFYIIWPLLAWFAWKKKFNFLWVSFSILLVSFLLNIVQVHSNATATFYSPQTRFWELLIGSSLAYVKLFKSDLLDNLPPNAKNLSSVIGLTLIGLAVTTITKESAFPGWWALMPTVGTALIIAAGMGAWVNQKVLSNKILVWVGLISFPLYLWHWPLLSFEHILISELPTPKVRIIAILAAFVLAWLSYQFVEKPLRFRKDKKVTIILFSLMIAVGLVGYVTYLKDGLKSREVANLQVVNQGDVGHDEFREYYQAHFKLCTPLAIRKEALPWKDTVRCFQSKEGQIDTVIIGDSHAEHLFLGLAEELKNKNVGYYIKSGLPIISNKEFSAIFNEVANNQKITTVIMSSYWSQRLKEVPTDSSFKNELQKTINMLNKHNKNIYILDDTPNFSFSPKNCKFSGSYLRWHTCEDEATFFGKQKARYIHTLDDIEKVNLNVKILRTTQLFCDENFCYMAKNGELLYRDPNHLSINGSRFVAKNIILSNSNLSQ
ncbi:acyltransferase family protein [Methylotenera versatilis]|uniref:Acyltransferase 3 n=1 Tax=Methylotenera versatilis (strain 301) TaxID=666681 RepID=D7DLF2_METV0|nr:acyltransferase family protein [Methylotenera versatilis]ADI30623.1 acyltransferase 3 [Methylotenera versatilis 301]